MNINTVDEYLVKLQELQLISNQLASVEFNMNSEIQRLHEEELDVLHYIEMGKFNASQGYNTLMDLKRILNERRRLKDLQYSVEKTKPQLSGSFKNAQGIQNSIGRVTNVILNNETRTYTIRQREDLVKKMNGKFIIGDGKNGN